MNESLTAHSRCATKYFRNFFMKACSSHPYASFGTFCVQIGQLLVAQWVFKYSEEFHNIPHFHSITGIFRFSKTLQRLTLPRIIDQFGRERYRKKRKDVDCKVLQEFFRNILLYIHERLAVINSFSTYVNYTPDGLFWLNMYVTGA